MNVVQFTKIIEEIQPIFLPFYLDEYSSRDYDLDNVEMKSGDYIILLNGNCHYNKYTASFQMSADIIDIDGQFLEITPEQTKTLKRTLINNIIYNERKHSEVV